MFTEVCHFEITFKFIFFQGEVNNWQFAKLCFQSAQNSILQGKTVNDLQEIFTEVSHVLETAASMNEPQQGRSYVIQGLEGLRERMKISASNGRKSDGESLLGIRGIYNIQSTWHDLDISVNLTVILLFLSVLPLRNATDATTANTQVLHVSLGKR